MHPCRGERRFALPSHPDLNRHPPLEGNDIGTACRAPTRSQRLVSHALCLRCASPQPFVRHAPTLGGECYERIARREKEDLREFQWAPTLGGECYAHCDDGYVPNDSWGFQWAPTLGGECYRLHAYPPAGGSLRFNGHPPLGVNATVSSVQCLEPARCSAVSMGTHPWG